MRNIKVRGRILMGLVAMLVIGVAVGVTGYVSLQTTTRMSRDLEELKYESYAVMEVLNAHYVWRQGVTEAVLMEKGFTGSLDHENCALGKWLQSDQGRNISHPEVLALLDRISEPHEYIHKRAQDVVALIGVGEWEQARNLVSNDLLPRTQDVIGLLNDTLDVYVGYVSIETEEMLAVESLARILIISLIGVAVVLGAVLSWFIPLGIINPLKNLAAFMNKASSTGEIILNDADKEIIAKYSKKKDEIGECIASSSNFVNRMISVGNALETIADGDLTADLPLLSENDVMGASLKKMSDSLNGMFKEINISTEQVASGSKQVADGAQNLAQGSTEQASVVQQLSASINDIADKTKTNAQIAIDAATLADNIKGMAEEGSHQMEEMMVAVKDMNNANQSINKIIKTIDDIAFQTNILALNAAVEAARAGQHGKGFAVVSEEVRNLAAKSALAAKETAEMIQNSIEKAELGVNIAGETAKSLGNIVDGISENQKLIDEIAKFSEEQTHGIDQINTGIEQVAQVIQQNNATAQESAAASQEMSGQASLLEEMISRFRLRDEWGHTRLLGSSRHDWRTQGEMRLAYAGISSEYGKY